MLNNLLADEQFTNIQKAQAGLTRIFQDASKKSSFYRVLKNDQSLGVLLPDKLWKKMINVLNKLEKQNKLLQNQINKNEESYFWMKASESTLSKIWDNEEDSIYDKYVQKK